MRHQSLLLVLPLLICTSAGAQEQPKCPRAVGIKETKEFLRKQDIRCFDSTRQATKAGFAEFGSAPTPTPTPTPSPTATPSGFNFNGVWTSGSPGLARLAASDTCDDKGLAVVSNRAVTLDVTHDRLSGYVLAEDTSGRRLWGVASLESFLIADANSSSECSSGVVAAEYGFGDVTTSSATLTVTEVLTCPTPSTSTCTRVFTGSVTR